MRTTQIFCEWCEEEITNQQLPEIITIKTGGEVQPFIDYCNEDCKKEAQDCCERDTSHKNTTRDDSQGICLDCGISYADSQL